MGRHHRIEEFFDAAAVRWSVASAFVAGLAPDPLLKLWEWADLHRKLPQETTKEHGDYSTDRTPYAREIMENLSSSSPVIRTVVMKAAQVGGSEVGLNFLGYIADQAQGPTILVCPTIEMAERHSETRIKPMIRLSDRLKKAFGDPDSKVSGQKILLKRFPGGVLVITGANSGASLRSLPARYMIFEEPDAYPDDVDGEGSAVDIVVARGFTFGYRRKEYLNCTPKLASSSIIYAEFMRGDRRTYQMPCPDCGSLFAWDQSTFRWDGTDPYTAHHVCPHCTFRIEERSHKTAMMAAGTWIPAVTNPPRGMARSYYLPGFYSPLGMLSWSEIAKAAIAAESSFSKAKTYYNTFLGLPWTDATDAPDPDEILRVASLSPYRAREVPDWAVVLKAGIDVGQDHIEIAVWAFGPGQRRHLVEQIRLTGAVYDPLLFGRLSQVLKRGYLHPNGAVMRISHSFIDRGRWPDVVDPWIRSQDPKLVSGSKGHRQDEMIRPRIKEEVGYDGKPIPGSFALRYFLVSSDFFKLELYGLLNRGRPQPSGEVPLPVVSFHSQITRDYAEQVVGEEYVTTVNKAGRATSKWVQKLNGRQRVEALDTANYARAAAAWDGIDNWTPSDWARAADKVSAAGEDMQRAIEAETRKRVARGDDTPVEPWHLVDDVALPTDVEADIEEAAMEAVSRGVPTPTGTVAWSGSAAKVPSEHTVVQGVGPGVVGAASAPSTKRWVPEFGSMFD